MLLQIPSRKWSMKKEKKGKRQKWLFLHGGKHLFIYLFLNKSHQFFSLAEIKMYDDWKIICIYLLRL